MSYDLYLEYTTMAISLLGGLGTFFTFIWIKVIKPVLKVVNSHDSVVKSIDFIRKELTTNGGNSLKDTVNDLKKICGRIETRQRVIEQRTKAALHYIDNILFETDSGGRITWANANFCKFFNSHEMLEGYDWLNFINEEDREELLQEFMSCLDMNRKFSRTTTTCDGKEIRMLGYPYKITDVEQGGFLVSISETKEV